MKSTLTSVNMINVKKCLIVVERIRGMCEGADFFIAIEKYFHRDAAKFLSRCSNFLYGDEKNALSSAWKITIQSAIFLTLINSLFFFRNGGLEMCVFCVGNDGFGLSYEG